MALDARIVEGRKISKGYAGWAASAGLSPIPMLDLAGLMAVQVSMLRRLAALYGVPFDRRRAHIVLAAAVGSLAPQGAAGLVGLSSIKAIPFWGGLVGMVAMPAMAVASTMAVADWFLEHLQAGGTLDNADPVTAAASMPEAGEPGTAEPTSVAVLHREPVRAETSLDTPSAPVDDAPAEPPEGVTDEPEEHPADLHAEVQSPPARPRKTGRRAKRTTGPV